MVSNGNVITLDAKRFRPGMRGLAHEIAVEISSPLNADLWKPCETKESKRITASHITGALGPIAHLWSSDDWDASSRIIHMSILLLYAISSGQYLPISCRVRSNAPRREGIRSPDLPGCFRETWHLIPRKADGVWFNGISNIS